MNRKYMASLFLLFLFFQLPKSIFMVKNVPTQGIHLRIQFSFGLEQPVEIMLNDCQRAAQVAPAGADHPEQKNHL